MKTRHPASARRDWLLWAVNGLLAFLMLMGLTIALTGFAEHPENRHMVGMGAGQLLLWAGVWFVGAGGWFLCKHHRDLPVEERLATVNESLAEIHELLGGGQEQRGAKLIRMRPRRLCT